MHASRVHASRILARKTVAQKLRWSSTEAVGANLGVTPEFGIPNDGSSGSSSTGPESNPSIQKREQKFQRHVKHKSISPRLESQDLCTITIRTWTFMTHISQLYTLVRALEEKYGPIREFRFRKDDEVNTRYQLLGHAVFCHQTALEKIPRDGITLHVPAPNLSESEAKTTAEPSPSTSSQSIFNTNIFPPVKYVDGGWGLDSFKNCIDGYLPFERRPDLDPDSMKNAYTQPDTQREMISFKVQRASRDIKMPPPPQPFIPSWFHRQHADAFLKWGGFHSIQPIKSDVVLKNSYLLNPNSPVDNICMRTTMRTYARTHRMPNMLEYSHGENETSRVSEQAEAEADEQAEEIEAASARQWEPLSGAQPSENDFPSLRNAELMRETETKTEAAKLTAKLTTTTTTTATLLGTHPSQDGTIPLHNAGTKTVRVGFREEDNTSSSVSASTPPLVATSFSQNPAFNEPKRRKTPPTSSKTSSKAAAILSRTILPSNVNSRDTTPTPVKPKLTPTELKTAMLQKQLQRVRAETQAMRSVTGFETSATKRKNERGEARKEKQEKPRKDEPKGGSNIFQRISSLFKLGG